MLHTAFNSNPDWFKQLFESSPDPTWIIDGNRFIECNEAAVRTLGYSNREEFLNVHPSKLSPPRQPDGEDSYSKAERMIGIALAQGLHRFEWMHSKADGTSFIAEVTLSIVKLEDRRVLYCVWRDITARKVIEEKLLQQNNTLSTIIENFPGGISLFDAGLRLVAHNEKFRHLMDLPDSLFEKPDVHFEDFIRFNAQRGDYGPGDPAQQVSVIVERARKLQPHRIERVRPNGVVLEILGIPLPDGGFVTLYTDITERKQANLQQRIAATAFESQEGMLITDAQKKILRVNRAFCDITGYSAEEAVGQTPRLLQSGLHDAAFYASMMQSLRCNGIWQGEIWDRRKNSEVYPEWLMITAVKDDAGEITNYVGALTDITERKLAEDEIRSLAFYDSLTQLPNRRLLNDRLGQTLVSSKRGGGYGALMFLDLDNFKPLNDTYGHAVGDLLLIEAAGRLRTCVREMDTVSRFGGDEFVVVLSDLNGDKTESTSQAGIIAEKIRLALSEPYCLTVIPKGNGATSITIEHHCTASIGVTLFTHAEMGQDDILKWADGAMYQAKEAGRNLVRFYESTA